jgi:hypothetical protein
MPDDGKVQKSSYSVCYTPSSEPFRIYMNVLAGDTLKDIRFEGST